jgi:chromosome segregation ATPase
MNRFSCLLPFALLSIFLSACESQDTKALQERWEYFDRQISIYEERVQKVDQKLLAEKAELEEETVRAQPALKSIQSREAMVAEIRELIGGLATLESSMLENAGSIEAYKKVFVPKSIPPQTNLGDLTLTEGTSYKSVVVRDTTPTHLNIVHSAGFSQVPIGVLPDNIKSQISMAPVETLVAPDPRGVIARKPASIKSDAEHAADRAKAFEDLEKERSELNAKRSAEQAEIERKKAEDREKWDAYTRESSALDQQIRALDIQILNLEREKSDLEFANQTGTVKLARADFVKKLRPFDEKISALREQLGALQAKKAGLRPPVR